MQHGMLFDGRSDNMFTNVLSKTRTTENGPVHALRSAARKNDLAGLAAQDHGRALSSLIKQSSRSSSNLVNTRWVAKFFPQTGQHRLPNSRVQWRCGVEIEINWLFHALR